MLCFFRWIFSFATFLPHIGHSTLAWTSLWSFSFWLLLDLKSQMLQTKVFLLWTSRICLFMCTKVKNIFWQISQCISFVLMWVLSIWLYKWPRCVKTFWQIEQVCGFLKFNPSLPFLTKFSTISLYSDFVCCFLKSKEIFTDLVGVNRSRYTNGSKKLIERFFQKKSYST